MTMKKSKNKKAVDCGLWAVGGTRAEAHSAFPTYSLQPTAHSLEPSP
jgi:hypothetical protein